MATLVVAGCGLVIGLAVFLLVRSLSRMVQGRCCEGCRGCSLREGCEAADPPVRDNDDPVAGSGPATKQD